MNYRQILFLISIAALVSSCFTYRSYVPLDVQEINLELPMAVGVITIDDKRKEISKEDDIKIPFISGLKRKAWKHHPKTFHRTQKAY